MHERTLESWLQGPQRDALSGMLRRGEIPEEADELLPLVSATAGRNDAPGWLRAAVAARAGGHRRTILSHPAGGFVLRAARDPASGREAGAPTDEDDACSATVEVALADHVAGVSAWATRFGRGAGLPDELTHDLALAARLHDRGKVDPRQQVMFHGGNPLAAATRAPLASSARYPSSRAEYRRACRESGFPVGGRHELLSVALAGSAPDLLASAHDPTGPRAQGGGSDRVRRPPRGGRSRGRRAPGMRPAGDAEGPLQPDAQPSVPRWGRLCRAAASYPPPMRAGRAATCRAAVLRRAPLAAILKSRPRARAGSSGDRASVLRDEGRIPPGAYPSLSLPAETHRIEARPTDAPRARANVLVV